jgi:quercetin dioxygenase-like cupin family protein
MKKCLIFINKKETVMNSACKKEPADKCAASSFESGTIFFDGRLSYTDEIEWSPHPAFTGVYLKHLITGKQTDNQVSCHLVRINPGCELGMHAHCGKSELHEVVEGNGHCEIGLIQLIYNCGTIAFIRADESHKVNAGDNGLVLLAKFVPALF